MNFKGNEMKAFLYEGRLTIVMEYTERDEYALLDSVEIGYCDTAKASLSHPDDVLLYCEMLSEKLGMPVYRNEKHAKAVNATKWELIQIVCEVQP